MGGCLEFIEYLWVGDCNPVKELGELFVGVSFHAQVELQRVDYVLQQREVAVGRGYCFMQSMEHENIAAASLLNWLG